MKDFKFKMGEKVTAKGKVGIITAYYDRRYTPEEYKYHLHDESDYRISLNMDEYDDHSKSSTIYALEEEIKRVKIIKAYCFQRISNGQYQWFDDAKKRSGFSRVSSLDHEFEREY